MEIMQAAQRSDEGAERLANIKRIFLSQYNLELSETMLGHTKLSELLQDPRLADICSVELRNGGYAVVPSAKAIGTGGAAMMPPESTCGACTAFQPQHGFDGLQLNFASEVLAPPQPAKGAS